MLSQLVILQFLCDTQTHQPRTHLSQSRAQLPLLAQGKRKILHSISVSFLTLLFIHSYNNYPWVKEYGQAAPTDHRAWLPRIEHIWDYSEVDARFYFSTFISNTKCFTKAQILSSSWNAKFEAPLHTFGVFVPTRADHEEPSQLYSWTQAPELAEAVSLRSHEGSEIVFQWILFPPNGIQFVSTEQCIASYLAWHLKRLSNKVS